MPTPKWREESVAVAGINVHFYCGGEGPPLVILHGGDASPEWLMHHQALAEHFRVYAPSHPGFGVSPRLEWIARIGDMAVFYLWMMEALKLERLHLMGHALGGWVAADIATTCPQIIDRLVLIDAAGIKPQHQEILDVFLLTPQQVRDKAFYNPQQVPEWQRLYGQAPTPEAADRAEEALETLVRLCWKPYMHDLRLPFLLPRVQCPTLIVWGREDAIIPLECGELYQRHIAGSRLAVLDDCGHYPHVEKPQLFANTIVSFLKA